jgi:catechol 2,3-dioxygenase-like lactoylglutathione lyase family enzyme
MSRSLRCRARRPRGPQKKGADTPDLPESCAEPPPFALEGLDHVVILVADLEAATAFYCGILGCTEDRALPQHGLYQLRAGASLIDLVDIGSEEGAWARPAIAGGRNIDHFCLATGPWEEGAMRRWLEENGVEIVEEGMRYGAKGDGLSFYVKDPFGNVVELKRPD